ncbi:MULTISPECIES: slipin family protein [Caulobacter]|jgi:regulator of protease activity HflC (stomatin/prohibitin superfamily)|uniref:Regulator of protease activity HflC (Stomatin/prohibitin superfamily) n=1 Tax=Caulobacter rhizosphaerae TaxID=2010972 RepID=A0ABU1N521_9CAUL|nr:MULTISPECIES: slipin family protein [Caulobacter]MDR6533528.1 regulator of protease activity HflC (stomatin/prohibitin superfamily) [Caulobacter rhizosphaerae]GGL42493.1 peptidase [Caulobacter rhizosphaerae]
MTPLPQLRLGESLAGRLNAPAMVLMVVLIIAGVALLATGQAPLQWLGGLMIAVGVLTPLALKMAQQWERAIVLRLGRFHRVAGPGLFLTIPVVDEVAYWIDQRIQTTEFNAQQALSKDTVPVNIDAVIFWQVHDTERAALEIQDYKRAIAQVAETSLREMVGSSTLATLLAERKKSDGVLREVIGRKTADWGISVISVEIRDIGVPAGLQDAMSRQAQAERERLARVALGQAEQEVAEKFVEAAEIYARSPTALQLRAMNIIYETTKEGGATILLPTAMVDAMNPGGVLGLTQAATASRGAPPSAT